MEFSLFCGVFFFEALRTKSGMPVCFFCEVIKLDVKVRSLGSPEVNESCDLLNQTIHKC